MSPPTPVAHDSAQGPESAHFLPIPSTKPQIVFVDTLENTQNIAKWDLWSSPALSSGEWHPPRTSPPFEVRSIENKGMGMVASRAIKAGELVISEMPTFVIRGTLEEPDLKQGIIHSAAWDLLAPERREALLSLANSFAPEDQAHVPGTHSTNWYHSSITERVEPDHALDVHSLYETLSRANHTCSPNVQYSFHWDIFSGQFHALRDIEAGEEISIQYWALLVDWEERQKDLVDHFRFSCTCGPCSLTGEARAQSDKRRTFLSDLADPPFEYGFSAAVLEDLRRALNGDTVPSISGEGTSPEETLAKVKQGLQYAEEENILAHIPRMQLWSAALLVQLGRKEEAKEWALKGRDGIIRVEGDDSYNAKYFAKVVRDAFE